MGGEAANVGKWLGASYTYFSSLALCQEICNARPGCTGVDHAGIESSGYGGGSQCYLTLDGCSEGLTSSGNWAHFAISGATPTAKWGDIGDWDVSSVEDFCHAFSKHRNQAGSSHVPNGNPNAAKFDADLGKWDVRRAKNMEKTFSNAASFVGNGLEKWSTPALVGSLYETFSGASSLGTVNLGGWDVSRITNMASTFFVADQFVANGLQKWKVKKSGEKEQTVVVCNVRMRDEPFQVVRVHVWSILI